MFAKIFNRNVVSNLILFLITLLPLFYLPLKFSALSFSKTYLVYLVVFLVAVIALISTLRNSENRIQINIFSIASFFVIVSYLLSTIFSINFEISFWGRDFALDSFITIAALFSLMCLIINFFDSEKTLVALSAVAVTTGFVSFVQFLNFGLLDIILPLPSLGIFYDNAQNLVGKVNDLAFFATIGVVLVILALDRLKFNQKFKITLCVIGILNLALIFVINFRFSLYILVGFCLVFGAYNFLSTRKINYLNLIVGIVAVLYIFFGSFISSKINSYTNFNYLEVRPSVSSTVDVTNKALKDNVFFGTGPATYEVLWPMHKPMEIVQTEFWNLDLRYGNGLLSSFVVTTGIVGGIFWILFLATILFYSLKSLFLKTKDAKKLFVLNATAFLTLIFWIISIFYIPNILLFTMTFIVTGLFILNCKENKIINSREIVVNKLLSQVFVVLIIFAIFVAGFKVTEKFAAHIYFQRANNLVLSGGNFDAAEVFLNKALHLDKIDTYYRSLATLNAAKISSILNSPEANNESNQVVIQDLMKKIIDNYNLAIQFDPNNYNNFIGLADFYTDLASISVAGSAEAALALYNNADGLKPNNPLILLKRARLAFLMSDLQESRDLALKSLTLRPDNLDALLLLTQIDITTGNQEDAVQNMKNFIKAYPYNHDAMFQLGLTYLQLGQRINAINQFEQLYEIYPNNKDLEKIISDLKTSTE